jgi:hypothetical protein
MLALPQGHSYVCYSRPGADDTMTRDFDAAGHLSPSVFDAVNVPRDADVYICGPTRFIGDMEEAIATRGVPPEQVHVELFNGSESMTPGVVGAATRAPHLPEDDAETGPVVSFARSGITAHWTSSYHSILELAEACDIPSGGRAGPACVTTARAGWFPERSFTGLSHSTSPRTAISSSAARNRSETSSSICERTRFQRWDGHAAERIVHALWTSAEGGHVNSANLIVESHDAGLSPSASRRDLRAQTDWRALQGRSCT